MDWGHGKRRRLDLRGCDLGHLRNLRRRNLKPLNLGNRDLGSLDLRHLELRSGNQFSLKLRRLDLRGCYW